MMENDPLDPVLHEWQAPEPPAAMDARALAAFRTAHHPSPWNRFLRARVSVPVPVLAALMLIVAALLLQFRWGEPRPPLPQIPGYVTRIEASGFQPLREGAVRVVPRDTLRRQEVRQ